MRSPTAIALALLSMGGVTLAADNEPASVIEAEYAFAASAKPLGVRGAFLKYLAGDSILCSPAPVNGITATAAGRADADTLEWYPTHSITASSGDLGYTTGPWTYRTADGKTERYGTFLSVWRKQPDGKWRVALDCGVAQPKPDTLPAGLRAPSKPSELAGSATPSTSSKSATNWKDPVAAADARFTSVAARSGGAALNEFAASDVRVMAGGASTAVGIAQAEALVNAQKLGATWQHVFASQSQDETLGYTWGYIGDAKSDLPTAVYVNVWSRSSADAQWQIVAQSLQKLPQKP